jgi:hypothetical protein
MEFASSSPDNDGIQNKLFESEGISREVIVDEGIPNLNHHR